MEEEAMVLLPDDLLANVVGRLQPCSLAASRKDWRTSSTTGACCAPTSSLSASTPSSSYKDLDAPGEEATPVDYRTFRVVVFSSPPSLPEAALSPHDEGEERRKAKEYGDKSSQG
ncbi:hypothetical protein E2562_033213 [Oryza meyeriana var. granulata]|uniref:F-box domain-containing protein n=1 Tax=Oryza meyeriana var. granulata TaxID=110450 RepID=A0A6G1BPQ6_9ORYZ|nr:hypothetical protein E2562_033213 [Oryza meyeriana var. granulata]